MTERLDKHGIADMQSKLAGLLIELTNNGKIEWFRQLEDSSLVFGVLDGELLVFELTDGAEENERPFDDTYGIMANIRNQTFMWLKDLDGWDDLIRLFCDVPVSPEKFVDAQVQGIEKIVNHLEVLVAKVGQA